jgi:UDPglucose 6-dehydrogenase
VCRDLLQEQAQLAIYDPKVPAEQVHADLQPAEGIGGEIEICSDPYQAAAGAQVVAVMTEWDEFRDLDYQRIYDSMLKPALIFDGRNILDLEPLREMGFKAEGIGKG